MRLDSLPDKLLVKLDAYRAKRREATGKIIMRSTAITELLTKALDGIEPASPLCDRLAELEHRISQLESDHRHASRYENP